MRTFVTLFLLSSVFSIGLAQDKFPARVTGTVTNDDWDFISANRMLMWASNNGGLSHNKMSSSPGLEWPLGSGKYLGFMEGLVHGGLFFGQEVVGGSTYNHGWQAGRIREDGGPDDPNNPLNRIYRAHRFDGTWWNAQPDSMKTQLLTDLREWPVQHGAPWIDSNGNGIYDPDTAVWRQGGVCDIPRIPGEEALWFVSNDLDARRARDLYGSGPCGFEMHTMIWASSGHPLLENVIFREHTIIHKGPEPAEDMYIGAWEDMDMGETADDFCGIDTTLGMAYTYNGISTDEVYGIPPATGTVWLQTPVIPRVGATARFGLDSREGYANLPLSGFTFYIGGSGVYRDSDLGILSGTTQMRNNLRGLLWNGSAMIDPTASRETRLALSGDPVLNTGWVDGIINAPGDRRYLSSSGPFLLATPDTQKVLFARVAVNGGNYLLSVRALRNAARQLHDIYRNLPMGAEAPVFSSAISFLPTPGSFELRVHGGPFPAGTSSVTAVLRDSIGWESAPVALLDDGTNGDDVASDGIFGGTVTGITPRPEGADLFVRSTDSEGVKEWFVESEIPLAGEAHVRIAEIVSDSRNSDGVANPGENLHIRLRFENNSTTTLGPWHLFLRDSASLLADWKVLRHSIPAPAGDNTETLYNPARTQTFLSVTIPEDTPDGTTLRFPVTLMCENYHAWNDTLLIEVEGYDTPPTHGLLAHVEGNAFGTLGYSILEPSALTMHDYRVRVEGEDFGMKTLWVEDVTLSTTLHRGLALPEKWVRDSPTIDGWRLTMGTAFDQLVYGVDSLKLDSFNRPVVGKFSEASRAWFSVYEDYLLIGEDLWGSKLSLYDVVPVKLVFDRNNGQKALGYMRGLSPNYGYQGYFDVPVRAYDMTDTTRPRQLMLGFSENFNSGGADSTWLPTPQASDRELLLIYLDDYSETPDPKFQGQAYTDAENLDLLYMLYALRNDAMPMFEDGDEYTITAPVPVSKRDVYIFPRPRLVDVHSEATQPTSIALHANYPNPFGPGSAAGTTSTAISFDLPRDMHTRISVYDLLGRRVATILDQTLPAGTHSTRFAAAGLISGVYLLSLETEGARRSRTMMLMQ